MSKRIPVVVIDDTAIKRRGMCEFVEETALLRLHAQAGDVTSALDVVEIISQEQPQNPNLTGWLVLSDLRLGDGNGVELGRSLLEVAPGLRVKGRDVSAAPVQFDWLYHEEQRSPPDCRLLSHSVVVCSRWLGYQPLPSGAWWFCVSVSSSVYDSILTRKLQYAIMHRQYIDNGRVFVGSRLNRSPGSKHERV